MGAFAISGILLVGAVVALIPCVLIWNLCKALAYRFTKDDENLWVIVPSFIGIMLAICALLLIPDANLHRMDAHARTLNGYVWCMIYCLVAAGGVLIFGVLRFIWCAFEALFDGLAGLIRGNP